MCPHLDVVGHMTEIINLGPFADDRRREGGPIDRRIGADFDIVFDKHVPHLFNFDVLSASGMRIAETVAADDGVGMYDTPTSNSATVVDNTVRMNNGTVADDHVVPYINSRHDPAISADPHIRPQGDIRKDHGGRVNVLRPSRGEREVFSEQTGGLSHAKFGIAHNDADGCGRNLSLKVCGNQHRCRSGHLEVRPMLVTDHVGKMHTGRVVKRGNPENFGVIRKRLADGQRFQNAT